jgi:AcrR family transcriptional regulator
MADHPAKEPNQRDLAAAEARTKILAAAAECIVRDGLAKVRMAGIAKAAGVSAGLLHYHFDTKEQLFADVLTYSHGVSNVLNEQALRRAGDSPAHRLSSFLDRCLPSDERLADEWLLWQELALLCIRKPELAKVGADLYEDFYSTVAGIIAEGIETGVFAPAIDTRKIAETAVALCDGLGARVVAHDPGLNLAEARTTIAATVGMLVGHDGPLPEPVELLAGSRQ